MDCPDVEKEEVCLVPVTPPDTQLFKISVENSSFILFEGSALHLWFSGSSFFVLSLADLFFFFFPPPVHAYFPTVQIAEFSPRRWWLPSFTLPTLISQFLNYLASLSLALGVLNLAPVYFLDGEWACWAFISLLLPGTVYGKTCLRLSREKVSVLWLDV
jgi:membrane-associated protease RseP (regulator of RpoE activity)